MVKNLCKIVYYLYTRPVPRATIHSEYFLRPTITDHRSVLVVFISKTRYLLWVLGDKIYIVYERVNREVPNVQRRRC